MKNIKTIIARSIYCLFLFLLTGCMGPVFTGANLIYDRHNVYLKINDVRLAADTNRALFHDRVFKCSTCSLESAVFNRDILLIGYVPDPALSLEASRRLQGLQGKRRIFNQLNTQSGTINSVQDAWITLKLRGYILANSNIDPHMFKIITYGGVVYLMGDVQPEQADFVIRTAQHCRGVRKIVKLLQYYHLSKEKA